MIARVKPLKLLIISQPLRIKLVCKNSGSPFFFPENRNVFFFTPSRPRATEFRGCSVNPLSAERFEPELAAGVATRCRAAPGRPRCPHPRVLGSSNSRCALSQQKCGTVCGRDRNGSCLMPMPAGHPCIHNGALSLPNRASRTVKKEFSCFLSVKRGFPGLLVSADPRKLRAVAQKLRRVRCHIFFCALPGEFLFACIFKVHKY